MNSILQLAVDEIVRLQSELDDELGISPRINAVAYLIEEGALNEDTAAEIISENYTDAVP